MSDNNAPKAAEMSLGDIVRGTGHVLRRLGPAGPLALAASTLPAVGGVVLLVFVDALGEWLRANASIGLPLYVLAFAVLAGLAILPTYAQAILGGWAFGFLVGLPAALAGFLGGAALGYVVGLRVTGDRLLAMIGEKPKLKAVYATLLGSGFWKTLGVITLVRLNSPFALTNLVLAATRVNPVAYLIGTLVGLAPRTTIAVVLAAGLEHVSSENPYRTWIWIGSITVTIIVVLVLSHMANRAIEKVTQHELPADTPPPAGEARDSAEH